MTVLTRKSIALVDSGLLLGEPTGWFGSRLVGIPAAVPLRIPLGPLVQKRCWRPLLIHRDFGAVVWTSSTLSVVRRRDVQASVARDRRDPQDLEFRAVEHEEQRHRVVLRRIGKISIENDLRGCCATAGVAAQIARTAPPRQIRIMGSLYFRHASARLSRLLRRPGHQIDEQFVELVLVQNRPGPSTPSTTTTGP